MSTATTARSQLTTTKPEAEEKLAENKPIKAILDYKKFRENIDKVAENIQARKANADVQKVVQLHEEFVKLKARADSMRAERNTVAAEMKGKLEQARRTELIEKGKKLKGDLAVLEGELEEVELEMMREGLRIPNDIHPDAPLGPEDAAVCVKEVGEQRKFDFPIRDHVSLGEELGVVDFDAGAKVAGQKFYYLKNGAAMLEVALLNWAFQKLVARGFTPVITPDMVRSRVVEGCGFQPRGDNTQVYSIAGTDLCLVGTAEIAIGGYLMDTVFKEEELPLRMVAFSHCFRTEAGAAGAAGKGLYRVHQFSKIEMFAVSTPEQSDAIHEELRQIEEELFSELGLHFKVLDMPSEDLGAPAYRKYDVEAWMPGLNRYGEISSTSNCTDYQARRLNIRYRDSAGVSRFAHTLNGTACAVPRIIISILENFQQPDGSVVIPETLRPFLGGISHLHPQK